MLGPALALGTSLTGGVSDFLGGTLARRIGTLQFTCLSQAISTLLVTAWVVFSGEPLPGVVPLAEAVGAGLGVTVAIAAFFRAMVVGSMSIVAPISATGVVVPVIAGIVRGEQPATAQLIGIAAAILGIVLASRSIAGPERRPRSGLHESDLRLAILAALGWGIFLWLLAPASHHGAAWAVFISRAIPVAVLAAAVAVRRTPLRAARDRRTALGIVTTGCLAASAIALYALATIHGQLAIVSVLASLYPAVTVLLAHHVLGERTRRIQQVGITATIIGVVLLSA